jgi:uncharacterized protein (TIGR02246 family)
MYRPYGNSVPNHSPLLDVESTIRSLTQDYCTAFNTGNYDQVAALFASDGLYMPPNREASQGPRAIEWLLQQYGEHGYQDLRLETIRVDYAGDIAVEVGRYTIAIHQPDGTTFADRGKFVHAWRRLGAWLLAADSWSSNLPSS